MMQNNLYKQRLRILKDFALDNKLLIKSIVVPYFENFLPTYLKQLSLFNLQYFLKSDYRKTIMEMLYKEEPKEKHIKEIIKQTKQKINGIILNLKDIKNKEHLKHIIKQLDELGLMANYDFEFEGKYIIKNKHIKEHVIKLTEDEVAYIRPKEYFNIKDIDEIKTIPIKTFIEEYKEHYYHITNDLIKNNK